MNGEKKSVFLEEVGVVQKKKATNYFVWPDFHAGCLFKDWIHP